MFTFKRREVTEAEEPETDVLDEETEPEDADEPLGRRLPRLPIALGVATVLLGGLAVWFGGEADGLRSGPGAHNAALTDTARTSEVKGKITDAVNAVFSYDYTNTARTEQAARTLLTGKA